MRIQELLYRKKRHRHQLLTIAVSWNTFQYSLQCLFDAFLIKECRKLYLLHLNHNELPKLKWERGRETERDGHKESHDATHLPSSTSQEGKLLTTGWCLQDDNSDITHGNHSAQREYQGKIGRKLTFESQSCRSCETTRFSKPCRVILTSSILTRNIIK